jgi:hypothetical protein
VVDKNLHCVVKKDVVMNEVPGKSIVVVAKKATNGNYLQTAER